MSGSAKTRLHIANSVDELNKMCTDLPKILNVKAYLTTAENAFKKGGDCVTMGDEESAYLMYSKYIHIITCVQKLSDFKKNEKVYRPMVVPEHYQQAVAESKRLAASLYHRYNERHAHRLAEQRKELELERAKLKVREAKLEIRRADSVPGPANATVGWEVTTDPVSGLPQYDVVSKTKHT